MKFEPKLPLSCAIIEKLLEPLFMSYDLRNFQFCPCSVEPYVIKVSF
jgi:hypothetical protein